ncbi:COG0451: Nucleoside-diphosphate-sugar epimerases [Richelia intracellularis HM01]|nr:COG0451: Nucleoside-diphosphate-sugar epimerases [Richelia intracellularis HM01]
MAAWDRFCMSYHHFIYNYFINPSSFGLTNYCPMIKDILKIIGIQRMYE